MQQSRLVIGIGQSLYDVQRMYVRAVLTACNNKLQEASETLGISMQELQEMLLIFDDKDQKESRVRWGVKDTRNYKNKHTISKL